MLYWLGLQIYFLCLSHAVRSQEVQWGVLTASFEADALVLQKETLVRAPIGGKLIRLVPEGSKVRLGDSVARIVNSSSPSGERTRMLTATVPGVVSYHPDGWEGVLVPEHWESLSRPGLFQEVERKGAQGDREQVNEGEPVLKIIDNLSDPYLVLKIIDKGNQPPLRRGEMLQLLWDGGGGEGKIISVSSSAKILMAVVEVRLASPGLPAQRSFPVRLLDPCYEGVIVPEQALVRSGRGYGVYTWSPVGVGYVRVKLVGRLEHQAAVRGLEPGSEVVVNPGIAARIYKKI